MKNKKVNTTKKRATRKPKKEVAKLHNFKFKDSDFKLMKAHAKKYTKGNVSKWMRLAGTAFKPSSKDL